MLFVLYLFVVVCCLSIFVAIDNNNNKERELCGWQSLHQKDWIKSVAWSIIVHSLLLLQHLEQEKSTVSLNSASEC